MIGEIEREFIFFPTLHRIFASRPNVTPVVITTGVGPQGPKTVWIQPPGDNNNIDPVLLNEDRLRMAASQPRERAFGNDVVNQRKLICYIFKLSIYTDLYIRNSYCS